MFALLPKRTVKIQNAICWENTLCPVQQRFTALPGCNVNHINSDQSGDRWVHRLCLHRPWLSENIDQHRGLEVAAGFSISPLVDHAQTVLVAITGLPNARAKFWGRVNRMLPGAAGDLENHTGIREDSL